MASLFPPVEPRSLTGSGMSADPEAIQDLQATWEVRDRANRAKPRKKFHQVLKEVGEICNDGNVRDITSEEMEQIKMKDMDKDSRLSIIPKDKIKEMIGRSPDEWDSIMMRYWFEIKPIGNYGIR